MYFLGKGGSGPTDGTGKSRPVGADATNKSAQGKASASKGAGKGAQATPGAKAESEQKAQPPRQGAKEDAPPAGSGESEAPKKTDKRIVVELLIDPNDASSFDDRYTLRSDDGTSYSQTKTVKDDQKAGDRTVTLEFTELFDNTTYTLQIDLGNGSRYDLFSQVSFADLGGEP